MSVSEDEKPTPPIDPHAMDFLVCKSGQRREVLELFEQFSQREAGKASSAINRVWEKLLETNPKAQGTFVELLRLRYPRASRADIESMNAIVAPLERRQARQSWKKTMREVRKLFGGLDSNSDGGVDLAEFLLACEGVPGLPRHAELCQLFRSADADGNGVLDYDEFGALVQGADARLKEQFSAILDHRKAQLSDKWKVSKRTVLGTIYP